MRLAMSAFGTKRTSASASHMSAFGGKADIDLLRRKCLLMTQSGHWCFGHNESQAEGRSLFL